MADVYRTGIEVVDALKRMAQEWRVSMVYGVDFANALEEVLERFHPEVAKSEDAVVLAKAAVSAATDAAKAAREVAAAVAKAAEDAKKIPAPMLTATEGDRIMWCFYMWAKRNDLIAAEAIKNVIERKS
mgnify:CR=1 FL=1